MVRHHRRPSPWSYPGQRFPQRPQRRLVALRGRADTTRTCSTSSNSTSSTTTLANPSSPAHSLAERTPFPSPSIPALDSRNRRRGTACGASGPLRRPRKGHKSPENRCRQQDRVCSAQLSNLPLELAEPGGLGRRRAWPAAGIDLGLGHPTAQHLRVDPQLLTDPPARAGTRRRVLTGVQRHPDRPLPQFLRVLPRCHHRCSSRLDGLHQTRYSTVCCVPQDQVGTTSPCRKRRTNATFGTVVGWIFERGGEVGGVHGQLERPVGQVGREPHAAGDGRDELAAVPAVEERKDARRGRVAAQCGARLRASHPHGRLSAEAGGARTDVRWCVLTVRAGESWSRPARDTPWATSDLPLVMGTAGARLRRARPCGLRRAERLGAPSPSVPPSRPTLETGPHGIGSDPRDQIYPDQVPGVEQMLAYQDGRLPALGTRTQPHERGVTSWRIPTNRPCIPASPGRRSADSSEHCAGGRAAAWSWTARSGRRRRPPCAASRPGTTSWSTASSARPPGPPCPTAEPCRCCAGAARATSSWRCSGCSPRRRPRAGPRPVPPTETSVRRPRPPFWGSRRGEVWWWTGWLATRPGRCR